MTAGIPGPVEIAEVDGVGPNPETPQHDGVQRWCDLYPAQPFSRPHGRERGGGWQSGVGRRTKEVGGEHVAIPVVGKL
jgi:hypothetical protein